MTIALVSQDSLLTSPGCHCTRPPLPPPLRWFLSLQEANNKKKNSLPMSMYVQLSLSHESRDHVTCSLIVMLKPLQKERWKIPDLAGHALRPSDMSVCSYETEKGNSLCLCNFIALYFRHEEENICLHVGDSDLRHVWTSMNNTSSNRLSMSLNISPLVLREKCGPESEM